MNDALRGSIVRPLTLRMGPSEIQPGAVVRMSWVADRIFRGAKLVVLEESQPHFDVRAIFVGSPPCQHVGTRLPCPAIMFRDANTIGLGETGAGLDTASPGIVVAVEIENTTREPRIFTCELSGTSLVPMGLPASGVTDGKVPSQSIDAVTVLSWATSDLGGRHDATEPVIDVPMLGSWIERLLTPTSGRNPDRNVIEVVREISRVRAQLVSAITGESAKR